MSFIFEVDVNNSKTFKIYKMFLTVFYRWSILLSVSFVCEKLRTLKANLARLKHYVTDFYFSNVQKKLKLDNKKRILSLVFSLRIFCLVVIMKNKIKKYFHFMR